MELYHHGVEGQKWGVRNGPPYPLRYEPSSYNMKSLGKSPNNNTLYITGLSGSGKSTYAQKIKSPNSCIHLDGYLEDKNESARNKEFDSWLQTKGFDPKKMRPSGTKDRKERWKYIDKFAEELIPEYSKECYKNKKVLIVEGVQLLDDTMYPDKQFFKDKPLMIMNTPSSVSMYRAIKRDNIRTDKQEMEERLKWYRFFNTKISDLKKEVE